MKYLVVILFTFSFSVSHCQPPAGSTNYKPELDKFIGTWKWNDNSGSELILKLKKVMYFENQNGGYYKEILLSCHRYVQNGIVVEDNLSIFPNLLQYETGNGSTIFSSSINTNTLKGLFKDALLNKYERVRLIYNTTTSSPTLTWKLTNRESTYRIGIDPVPNDNTTLPKDLILVKQP